MSILYFEIKLDIVKIIHTGCEKMNRRKKFILNSFSGLFKQLVTLICGFVMIKAILIFYGSSVNGLVSSITQFLGFISFLEMGIGPVIQSNLYGPLAKNDTDQISRIIKSSEKFFRRIAYIFVVYIIILCFIFPQFINSDFSFFYTASLVIIISISSLAQYYFGMTYQLLLNADQKGYVQITLQWITLLINTILCILLMNLGASIHIVRLVTTVIYVLRPLFLSWYIKQNYHINKNVSYDHDPIKQKWNGFAQHLSAVIVDNTDVVILTIMSSLKNVSIYTVYYSVVYGITQVVMTTVNGLESMWGNMLARDEWYTLNDSFSFVEWFIHTAVTLIFTAAALLITPFVMVYTNGVNDANYYQPLFGVLLVAAFAMQCYRIPYFRLIKAAGHYKQTQFGALITMVLNFMISIILVDRFGLVGVAIGTLVALSFHTCYFAVYLANNILKRNVFYFIKHLFVNSIVISVSILIINSYIGEVTGYISWIFMAVRVSMSIFLISIGINYLFYKKYMKKIVLFLYSSIKNIVNKLT